MRKECPTCDAFGCVPCERCDGEGVISSPWDDPCPDCFGEGDLKCPTCDGFLIVEVPDPVLTEEPGVEIIQ